MGDGSLTDVLTFDLRGRNRGAIDGQILMCEEVARERAKQNRRIPAVGGHRRQIAISNTSTAHRAVAHGDRRALQPWQRELALYVVHGCLHLCGHDDRRPTDFSKMHALEDRILTNIGIGPVFDTQ